MSIGYIALNVINAAKRVVRVQKAIAKAIAKQKPTDELAMKRYAALTRLEKMVDAYEADEYRRTMTDVGSNDS
jgi:hypothetical protein